MSHLAAAFFVVAAISASPAFSQDSEKKESPLPKQLPLATEACFGRVYDAAHQQGHPKQRVTSFHIAREFTPDPNSEYDVGSPQELKDQDGTQGRVNVAAYVRFRDRAGVFANTLSCYKDDSGKARCGIDCDGGQFTLKPSGTSLLLENEGFVVVGGCEASEEDSDNREFVAPGQDDRVFRLDPKPMAACLAERNTRAPAYAKLGAPLRVRLAKKGAVCFHRAYDAAHLAAHPQQMVKRISIMRMQGEEKQPGEFANYDLTFRAELRDGTTVEKKIACGPDNYSYLCSGANNASEYGEFYLTRAGAEEVMVRDRKQTLAKLFETKLGKDDRFFKLASAPPRECAP